MAADVEISNSPPTRTEPSDIKLSRYQTVRKAQLKPKSVPPRPPVPENIHLHDTMQRSMSRYRRAAPARKKAETAPPIPVTGPVKKSVVQASSKQRRDSQEGQFKASHPYLDYSADAVHKRPRGPSAAKHADREVQHTLLNQRARRDAQQSETEPQGSLLDQQARRQAQPGASTEGQKVLAKEQARYEKIKAQQRAERAERDKTLEAEQRRREEEEEEIIRVERERAEKQEHMRRLVEEEREREAQEKTEAKQRAREERAARRRRPTDVTVPSQDSRALSSRESKTSPMSSKRIGGFFKRKKEDETPRTSMTTEERWPKTSHAASPPKWVLPTIKPGGGGIVPLADAPVSGVARAERRVRIRFVGSKHEITLPTEPTTPAQQLIKSAALIMSEGFDPRAAVIYEHYKAYSVRRPLRMYEHVRAVMNSWENDQQNYLVIEPSDPNSHNELYASAVPQQEPNSFERWLKYEYKPGRWDDRWVTLRSDGQITVAKNQSGKDAQNICHLSDFDIYRSIPEPKKRKKPSKKMLLSIKSQEKSAMFLDKSNYIRDFCTEDHKTGDAFFQAVQRWRSYYLINKMGQGQFGKVEKKTLDGTNGHKRSQSLESHYLLGSFNDLGLDFSSFAKAPEPKVSERRKDSFDENKPLGTFGMFVPSAQEHSKVMHQRQLSQRRERSRVPPTAMRHLIPSNSGSRDEALQALNANSTSGDRKHSAKSSQDINDGLQRNSSVRSTRSNRRNSFDSATLGRGNSVRRPDQLNFGKPLLDFTPQYKEPPQFANRGKGYKPDNARSGNLIDAVPSPENAILLPGNDDWRARPKTSGDVDRSKSINRSKSTRRQPNGMPPDDGEAFTGGLLALRGHSRGNGNTGHGVMSGNKAKGPMVDLNEPSMFESGSLLSRLQAEKLGNPIAREPWRVD